MPSLSNSRSKTASAPLRDGSVICGLSVDAGTYESSTETIIGWAQQSDSRYVCIANVHMTMEARDSASFAKIVDKADLVTSDGMPLVWMLRIRGNRAAERVYGPTLMLHVCQAAAAHRIPVAFFGGSTSVLKDLRRNLLQKYPALMIAAEICPPYGAFDSVQDIEYRRQLAESGAKIIFVGLGCPKQERWMAQASPHLPAVLLGVGAAFNFHAGHVRQSPAWLQKCGMEWAFRLANEPRRLWRRYLWHNPRFVIGVLLEEIGRRTGLKPLRSFDS